MVRLCDLKKGDKFYYGGRILILHESTFDLNIPNRFEFVSRIYKTREYITNGIMGKDVIFHECYRFNGRDTSSFQAGYRMAIEHCKEFMDTRRITDADIDTDLGIHMNMLKAFKNWKDNS